MSLLAKAYINIARLLRCRETCVDSFFVKRINPLWGSTAGPAYQQTPCALSFRRLSFPFTQAPPNYDTGTVAYTRQRGPGRIFAKSFNEE